MVFGYWPTAIQVAVGPDIHAVVRDGGGGIAAFIKIVDGENFEFPVPAHHDGFTVGIDAVNIAARGYRAAKETAAPYSASLQCILPVAASTQDTMP